MKNSVKINQIKHLTVTNGTLQLSRCLKWTVKTVNNDMAKQSNVIVQSKVMYCTIERSVEMLVS